MTQKPDFKFTRHGLTKKDARLERLLEVVPGAISWTLLLGLIALSFFNPILAALAIIAFDLYWLLRILYGVFFLVLAYTRLRLERNTDWLALARRLDAFCEQPKEAESEAPAQATAIEKLRRWLHEREIKDFRKRRELAPRVDDILHLVLIPIATETRDIIEPGVESMMKSEFPAMQILIVFALEERATSEVRQDVLQLQEKYRNAFYDVRVEIHPDGTRGEARVKGANITHAAKSAVARLKQQNIPLDHVVVSCLDSDTVVSPQYFSCLTYTFMMSPNRHRASFQPIPVYHNNIWEVPGFAKVIETGSSFFTLAESTNPGKLVTFSSHSMSLRALVEVGYWPVDLISDDSAIYWKAFLHYGGDYRVIPMHVTVSMDVADGGAWWKTAVMVYKQKRRWAWGVESFPIVIRGFLAQRAMSLPTKIRYGFRLLEGHISWATWSMLLAFNGLPALLVGQAFESSIVFYSSSRINATIFSLSSLALFVIIALSFSLLPKKRVAFPILKRVGFALQWFLLPITYIVLSALPALDAQTRLMSGTYMEFGTTQKRRRN